MASRKLPGEPPRAPERHAAPANRERWEEFLGLEHAVLSPLSAIERDGRDALFDRAPAAGRRIDAGGVPRPHAPGLLLQAAAAIAFFESRGFALRPGDLHDAI